MPERSEKYKEYETYFLVRESMSSKSIAEIDVSLDPEVYGWATLTTYQNQLYIAQANTRFRDKTSMNSLNLIYFNSKSGEWHLSSVKGEVEIYGDELVFTSNQRSDLGVESMAEKLQPLALIVRERKTPSVFQIYPRISKKEWDGAKFVNKAVPLYYRTAEEIIEPRDAISAMRFPLWNRKETEEEKPDHIPQLDIPSIELLSTDAVRRLMRIHHKSKFLDELTPEVIYDKRLRSYGVTLFVGYNAIRRLVTPSMELEVLKEIGEMYGFGERIYFIPDLEIGYLTPKFRETLTGTFYLG